MQDSYPGKISFSVIKSNNITESSLSPRTNEKYIDEIVAEAVDEVNFKVLTIFYMYFIGLCDVIG